MAAAKRNWIHVGVASAALMVWACVALPGQPSDRVPTQLERDVLASIAQEVMAPAAEGFAARAGTLRSTTAAWAEAPEDDQARLDAQSAWEETMAAWQRLELTQLGPLGSASDRIGGAGVRDEVYSWPSTNTCRVDQEIVASAYEEADFFSTRLVNSYGLDALEYLLFYAGEENSCPPQLPINAGGEWAGLDAQTLAARRAEYAAVLAEGLEDEASNVLAAWGSDGEWTQALQEAGEGSSAYETVFGALDEVLAVMFYLDQELKDLKLGKPGGLKDCAGDTCIADLELGTAGASKAAALANLEAFSALYFGGDGPEAGTGFDELLRARGADGLADDMADAIADALSAVEAVPGTFAEALLADSGALDQAHAAVKVITDLLKGEFATALSLQLPQEGGGDAD